MYKANRTFRVPSNSTFRKERKFENIIKTRLKPRDNSIPEGKTREEDNTNTRKRNIPSVIEDEIGYLSWIQPWTDTYFTTMSSTKKTKPEPIKKTKTVIIDGTKRTVEGLERFKKNQWIKLLEKGGRLHRLPDEIVETILEYTGTIENHNDYRILKLGFHDSYSETAKILKSYLIKRIIESSNDDFIRIIKYLYTHKDIFVGKRIKTNMERFLYNIELPYPPDYLDSLTLDEHIASEIEWAKKTNSRYETPIVVHLLKESCDIFTRKMIKNIL